MNIKIIVIIYTKKRQLNIYILSLIKDNQK